MSQVSAAQNQPKNVEHKRVGVVRAAGGIAMIADSIFQSKVTVFGTPEDFSPGVQSSDSLSP